MTERNQLIYESRLAGATMESIAERVGLKKQRVQQILKKIDPDLPARIKQEKANRRAAKQVPKFSAFKFCADVRRWLREAKYLICAYCKIVEPLDGRLDTTNQCRECNKRSQWAHKHNMSREDYAPLPFGSWSIKPKISAAIEAGMQWCSGCQAGKPLTAFYASVLGQRSVQCKECAARSAREKYHKRKTAPGLPILTGGQLRNLEEG